MLRAMTAASHRGKQGQEQEVDCSQEHVEVSGSHASVPKLVVHVWMFQQCPELKFKEAPSHQTQNNKPKATSKGLSNTEQQKGRTVEEAE